VKTIKELRLERQLSQEKLARLLGTHQTTVSFWECSYHRPQDLSLYRLAQVFGVRMDDIDTRRRVDRESGAPELTDQRAPDSVPQSQQSREDSDHDLDS
jgi:transcriptional regulator with XRE-family HTH domain